MWTSGCQSLTFSTRVYVYNNFSSAKHRRNPVFASTNKSAVDLSLPAKGPLYVWKKNLGD
ncbi:hypothetical protein IC575_024721 [Cucumis melo]